jgi:hypothetical protein
VGADVSDDHSRLNVISDLEGAAEFAGARRIDESIAAMTADWFRLSGQRKRSAPPDDFSHPRAPRSFDHKVDVLACDEIGPKTNRERSDAALEFGLLPLAHPGINHYLWPQRRDDTLEWFVNDRDCTSAAHHRRQVAKIASAFRQNAIKFSATIEKGISEGHPTSRVRRAWGVLQDDGVAYTVE